MVRQMRWQTGGCVQVSSFSELLPTFKSRNPNEPLLHGRGVSRCMTRDQALRVEFKPGASPLVSFAMKAETTARTAGHDRGLCGSVVLRQASTRGDRFSCHRSYC